MSSFGLPLGNPFRRRGIFDRIIRIQYRPSSTGCIQESIDPVLLAYTSWCIISRAGHIRENIALLSKQSWIFSSEPKSTKVNQSEPYMHNMHYMHMWTQVNQSEPKWTKVIPIEPKWTQVNPNELKSTQYAQYALYAYLNPSEPK